MGSGIVGIGTGVIQTTTPMHIMKNDINCTVAEVMVKLAISKRRYCISLVNTKGMF